MRVLIADGRPSMRVALRAVLEQDPDCESVAEAADAAAVLDALAGEPDLLLLQWGLPGLAAGGTLARVRAARPDLVVVALGRLPGDRDAALAAGAACYVDTNRPPDDFMSLLHNLCPGVLTRARSAAARRS